MALTGEDSELRGLLVADERTDGWEEVLIRNLDEVVMVTVHREPEAASRHAGVVADLMGQSRVALGGPQTSMALLPTMRSALRYR